MKKLEKEKVKKLDEKFLKDTILKGVEYDIKIEIDKNINTKAINSVTLLIKKSLVFVKKCSNFILMNQIS